MHWNWSQLCGRGVDSLTVWSKDDFGHCFEQLVFRCSTHAVFSVISAYYMGQHRHAVLRAVLLPRYWTLHIRFLCAVILFLLPIVFAVLTRVYLDVQLSLIDIAAACIDSGSWLIHIGFLARLHYDRTQTLRGPTLVILSFLLTLAAQSVQLRTIILHVTHHSRYLNEVEEYICFVSFSLYIVYTLTLIPSKRLAYAQQSNYAIQENDVGAESDPLLNRTRTTYGTQTDIPRQSLSLGIAEDGANCLSKLFFCWVNPLMVKGSHSELSSACDLFFLPKSLHTWSVEKHFKYVISLFKTRANEDMTDPTDVEFRGQNSAENNDPTKLSLLSALNKAFGCHYYSLGIMKLVADMLGFCGPLLLNLLVTYMENSNEPVQHGYLYAGGLFLSTFLVAMLSTHFTYQVQKVGLKIRTAIITTVYRKTMSVSSTELSHFSTGQVVNFMSTDTDRIVNFCSSFHQFWSLPFQIAVSLYLLYEQVGLAFLAGLTFAILLIPVNRWIAIKIGSLSADMMKQKDSRVKLMNEILLGMRVIKYYAWERHFAEKIDVIRDAELKSLKGRKYLDALCVYFWATTPVLISILTFTTYSLMGNKLTAPKVFTSLALFNMLISPLNAFPWVINGLMEAWVSLKRVEAFLQLRDLDWSKYYNITSGRDVEMRVEDGNFSWYHEQMMQSGEHNTMNGSVEEVNGDIPENVDQPRKTGTLKLNKINIEIKQGYFIGVIGKVGCGKSSLFSALLAEMSKESGKINIAGSLLESGFGLVTQESWIQHATVKDNILFGKEFDKKRYEKILFACALNEDLKMLTAGDLTEVGENGVTLSGGQKARITLARSIYQDKDIYLLDDPLAAVDAHVAAHLYEHCIQGLLKNKSVILCTHHVKYLRNADFVVVMDHGNISHTGPPAEILNRVELESVLSTSDVKADDEDTITGQEDISGQLVQKEEKDTGVVKLDVYKAYWAAVGTCLSPLVLFSLLLMQASRNINDWWLSYWVTHSHSNNHHSNLSCSPDSQRSVFVGDDAYRTSLLFYPSLTTYRNHSIPWKNVTNSDDNVSYYLMVYGILAGANTLFTLARAFLFAYGGICAATKIHRHILASILQAPVGFFDVTPIGRIMNRFSSDLYAIDDSLPFIMNILLAQFYGVLGTIAITIYGLPWFALVLVPLAVIYYYIQRYYRHTSREIKRITSVTLSPIYAHFSESLTGLIVIRAHRETQRFGEDNRIKLDNNQRAQFAGLVAGQWLSIRLQMMGVAMVTAVALIAVLEHHFHTVNPGLVGLAVSYALSITNLLSGVVTSFTETEKQMVSVERAGQYINDVPAEKQTSTLNVPPFWPIQGAIYFHRVSLRYRPNLPLALNNVTFETHPHEKIGIVGRTGSGKSSLFLTLFRMVEIESGDILIDGINLCHLDLQELRGRLAVIPQDPFLFSGTVRENLDPEFNHEDETLWEVLQRCHLRRPVEELGGLEAHVAERGRHFSVGQRQLVCLARALLTKAKVLCLDEATASVDQETDHLIQKTIREQFANNTVLTIAHRINTIMDSDRVIVMQGGQIEEFAAPEDLLQNTQSIFYGLVNGKLEN